MRNDTDGSVYQRILEHLPPSLQNLKLKCLGTTAPEEQYSNVALQPLLPALTNLSSLQLQDCSVKILGNSITCLSNLQSLDLSFCAGCVDQQLQFEQLTKLTCLDLTGVICFHENRACVAKWTRFDARPCLQVLKVQCPDFVGKTTVFHLSSVAEVHLAEGRGTFSSADLAGKHVDMMLSDLNLVEETSAALLGPYIVGLPALLEKPENVSFLLQYIRRCHHLQRWKLTEALYIRLYL